ncbi:RodZ domain-containing protein [Cellvibrio zantedeschiae]|nr:RodZ domain-containing protein [Cellvibrio zantedeschiae]
MLLQGRLQAGLTQEQVAKELYMTVYKVKALETDDYKRLNSDTFARGYIRAYANLVKVDVVAVLAAYDRLLDELRPQPVVQKQVAATENTHRGAWQFLAVIGAFFIGLWLISVWFFDNHSEAQYVIATDSLSSVAPTKKSAAVSSLIATSASSASSSVAVSSEAKTAAGIVAESASSVKSTTQLVTQASSVAQSTSSASAVQSSSSASSKKTSLDELSFSFRGESWLEVSDSRGDVLATELEPTGSKIRLIGMAPFDVKLGNAPVVDIQLNGKKIDVIPLMGSNVLIMKIGN